MVVSRSVNIMLLPVIFLVAFKIMHNPILVNGDATLIGRVCGKTKFPADCRRCFDSNPRSGRVDVRGLAGIAIKCSYAPAIDVDKLLTRYTRNGLSEYAFCLQQFDYIVQKVSLALQSWKNNRYQDSKNLVQKAIGDYFACLNGLKRPRYPDQFIEGLYRTRTSCENAVGVLSQIRS